MRTALYVNRVDDLAWLSWGSLKVEEEWSGVDEDEGSSCEGVCNW